MALIDLSSLIIQGINFAIIAFVLRRFFFIPYLKYIDEESQKRKELDEQHAKSMFIVDEAHNQAENIVTQSKLDAKMVALEIVDLARNDAKSITKKAQQDADLARTKWFADIALERKQLEEEMQKKVLDVALSLNKKIFWTEKAAHEQFLKEHIHA